jgi:hypothetical protein
MLYDDREVGVVKGLSLFPMCFFQSPLTSYFNIPVPTKRRNDYILTTAIKKDLLKIKKSSMHIFSNSQISYAYKIYVDEF